MLIRYPHQEQLSQFNIACNTGDVGLFSNVESACARGLPDLEAILDTKPPAIIVGGGPSLASTLESIRQMQLHGGVVFALNNAAKYLVENGIPVDYQIILDARSTNVAFLEKAWAKQLLLASQCHPSLFDKAQELSYPTILWHPVIEGIVNHIPKKSPLLIGGGLTVGLSGMCVIYTLGYRQMHLFGYDSCHSEELHHAYSQPENDVDELTTVAVDGRVFKCTVTMAAQANSFQKVSEMLADLDCEIHVYGDGLIPHIARCMTEEKRILTAIYDLAVSPPTYDFISFLSEAEYARREGSYTDMDIVFQPGPIGGFRHDGLPPSLVERESMLQRICIPACRLLPSVRNVTVLKARMKLEGDIFPKNWQEDAPVSQYGTKYIHRSNRPFRASKKMTALVSKTFKKPYVTITVRESDYWPERNSNQLEWEKATDAIRESGFEVFWIGDTEKSTSIWSWDIDARLALYENAVVNLAVSNGPVILLYCSDAPYITFKIVTDGVHSSSADFLRGHGYEIGDQFGPNGVTVWEDDKADIILREFNAFIQQREAA